MPPADKGSVRKVFRGTRNQSNNASLRRIALNASADGRNDSYRTATNGTKIQSGAAKKIEVFLPKNWSVKGITEPTHTVVGPNCTPSMTFDELIE